MRGSARGYRGESDILRTGRLLREAYRCNPSWNAWSFAHFDIWAMRRLADEKVFGRSEWHGDLQFWEGADDELIAAALVDCRQGAALIGHPERPDLIQAMLDWAIPRYRSICPEGTPQIEAMEGNVALVEALQERGYQRSQDYMTRRLRNLGTERDVVEIPSGYSIGHLETRDDVDDFHAAVEAVFNLHDCWEVHEQLAQAASAMPQLSLAMRSPEGEVVTFCSIWVDRDNNIAEFEPLGTVPKHRGRGLARVLMMEGCNRLRDLGVGTAIVDSWSRSLAANRLYHSAGFEPIDRLHSWGPVGSTFP
jgi:GNAT superfamily N-acetyltransferase